jgi:hypothetical protein
MSHFAEIDHNNIVLRVLVGDNNSPNEGLDWFIDNLGGNWVQTSYNANFRKKFAGIGDTYDANRDAFIAPQPFASWVLDEDCKWQAPIPYPTDGVIYEWSEAEVDWKPTIFDAVN